MAKSLACVWQEAPCEIYTGLLAEDQMKAQQVNKRVLAGLIFASLVALSGPAFALAAESDAVTKPAASLARPLQVTTIGPLDAAHLKERAEFRVRVAANWEGEHCRLKTGEIVRGRVSRLVKSSKRDNASHFQLFFTAPSCAEGQSQSAAFTLIGLLGPASTEVETEENRLRQAPPLVASVKEYGYSRQEVVTFGQTPSYSRNGKIAASNALTPKASSAQSLPQSITFGQVINAPRIALQLGTRDDPATTVTAAHGDARIESGSMLVLVPADSVRVGAGPTLTSNGIAPASLHSPDGTSGTAAAVPSKASAAHAGESGIENERCATSCVTLNSLQARQASNARSTGSISLRRYGYFPHQRGWARAFNHETTLTFLDEHHLLCTFDPHQLRTRTGDSPEPLRDIRAVLIDPATLAVQRVLLWRVRGDDTYLWRFGHGRVLVRIGNTLQLFDSSLSVMKILPVQETIAWVVSSPSNDHTAIAVASGPTVDFPGRPAKSVASELEVRVFDANLNLLSESGRAADLYPPVLLDGGELRLEHAGAGKWELLEYGWDQKVQTLAAVHSACRPLFSAGEGGLIFVTGCAALDGNIWYRMLDAKGHTLLKAESFSDEMAHRADAAAAGTFAIRVVRAARRIPAREPFRRSDLLQERIDVFRDTDGKRVESVTTDDFVLADSSFALSPGGDEMAIVGKEAIVFYRIGRDKD